MLEPAEPRARLPQTRTGRAPEQFLVVIITLADDSNTTDRLDWIVGEFNKEWSRNFTSTIRMFHNNGSAKQKKGFKKRVSDLAPYPIFRRYRGCKSDISQTTHFGSELPRFGHRC
jgi:hypothetical protein